MRLQYISSNGTSFDLLSWEGLKLKTANFHKYSWGVNASAKQYGVKLNYFTKEAQEYTATIYFRGAYNSRKVKVESFHACTEYDISHQTPGRIYWGSDYIDCYVRVSSTYPDGDYTVNDITIYCPYPFWIEEQTLSINPIIGSTGRVTDKGYPADRATPYTYPYEYSYPISKNATYMNIDHYADSAFKMVVYGPTSGVNINIAGNIYAVDHALRSNQYMIIDSRRNTPADKRCYIVSESGIVTNAFNYRDPEHPLFKPIPPGDVIINYARTYGIELTVYKERSEPRCLN